MYPTGSPFPSPYAQSRIVQSRLSTEDQYRASGLIQDCEYLSDDELDLSIFSVSDQNEFQLGRNDADEDSEKANAFYDPNSTATYYNSNYFPNTHSAYYLDANNSPYENHDSPPVSQQVPKYYNNGHSPFQTSNISFITDSRCIRSYYASISSILD